MAAGALQNDRVIGRRRRMALVIRAAARLGAIGRPPHVGDPLLLDRDQSKHPLFDPAVDLLGLDTSAGVDRHWRRVERQQPYGAQHERHHESQQIRAYLSASGFRRFP